MWNKILFLVVISLSLLLNNVACFAADHRLRGIYITQPTLENTEYITYLINRSKAVGINTFVIDFERPSKRFAENIQLIHDNDIAFVARIIVFPDGGTEDQIQSEAYWEKKYRLAKQAIDLGARSIQLDYIRYRPSQPASPENSKNIYQVIHWFKERLAEQDIPLQVDVFGISAFGESKHIGQNIKLFADTIDVLCPMVYPSHYEPYLTHSQHPYKTVLTSLNAIHEQMHNNTPFQLVPFIEVYNFRYWHPNNEMSAYIYAQIKATEDAHSNGWYAWSANNKYDHLFEAMQDYPVQ